LGYINLQNFQFADTINFETFTTIGLLQRSGYRNEMGTPIMSEKIITIEEQDGPFKLVFQRIMRMVPDRDKDDKNLQRLLAFRLKIDGEAALSEYLIRKIRDTIKCAYTGSLYDFLKDDLIEKECKPDEEDPEPPGAA
jgi:hypothetical protein